MPRIFDNIDQGLLPTLRETLALGHRGDFCVGYFNLRGWRHLASTVEAWTGGDGNCCRLLVGMPVDQEQSLRRQYSLQPDPALMDQATVVRLRRHMALKFREQLTLGAPTDADQAGLRNLSRQLKERKVVVRLHLRYPLHAKLYLAHRVDPSNPVTAFLGSSNLTNSGLRNQGELNIDVQDHDATGKLQLWFDARWNDRYCLDISDELAVIIDESWVTERSPYHVYIKMAYHLSREARTGIEEFGIPANFRGRLFKYQEEAVRIAAHHLDKRGGVLLGDVVGLGKTIMAAAVARLYFEKHGTPPLIICPPNLVPMWRSYSERFDLYARVLSLGSVKQLRGEFSRHRLVIIDESHNLRNREGDRYAAVKGYIDDLQAAVILLSATPYNKGYEDISSQLRLFLNESASLGIRPDAYLRGLPGGEIEFAARHQCPVHSIRAFEHSTEKEDWQQLMQRYMVRRTRSFIRRHYATEDPDTGRRYLPMSDGARAYLPDRVPRTVAFEFDETHANDPYARLFSARVVDVVNRLDLPRYGLGNYLLPDAGEHASNKEAPVLRDLGRAGKRLMGFCRTNLYKRLESSGDAFLLSVERHILRNYLFAHALQNGLEIPIGTQDPWMLDTRANDTDEESTGLFGGEGLDGDSMGVSAEDAPETLFDELLDQRGLPLWSAGPTTRERIEARLRAAAAANYNRLAGSFRNRFTWLRPTLFDPRLLASLESDSRALLGIVEMSPNWDPKKDRKLAALIDLVQWKHGTEKVLVFTQFADTAAYLARELRRQGVERLDVATGGSNNVTEIAARFSPISNGARARIATEDETRVLIATDVLSEGQNLQDAHVVVNFDLPWAIIRLVQRAGRVDRIGQASPVIDCHTFIPMQGVEQIIALRAKVRHRLRQNAEVVGTDESFFDDDGSDAPLVDLYNEKAGILDGTEDDSEVDLQSRAYQIYKDAVEANPGLAKAIKDLPDVVYSGKAADVPPAPKGVIVYLRTPDDSDALALVGATGATLTENQSEILDLARCEPNTPIAPIQADHHEFVRKGAEALLKREKDSGGALGKPSGARYRVYHLLKRYCEANASSLLVTEAHHRALEQMLRFPLRPLATDALNRDLRANLRDADVADHAAELYEGGRLCIVEDEGEAAEPKIICSLGLR